MGQGIFYGVCEREIYIHIRIRNKIDISTVYVNTQVLNIFFSSFSQNAPSIDRLLCESHYLLCKIKEYLSLVNR